MERNDDATSIQVESGCCVDLYEHADFKGAVFKTCKNVILDHQWNDRASSLKTYLTTRKDIIDNLIEQLRPIKAGADEWYSKHWTSRNRLASQAANGNYDRAVELLQLETSAAVSKRLQELYELSKKWENQFNNVWGGHRNTYAGWCHGEAKKYYHDAITTMKMLGLRVTGSSGNFVPLYSNRGLAAGRSEKLNAVRINLQKKVGYESNKAVSSELHSAITIASKAVYNELAASVEGSVEASVASNIKNSFSIQNTAEESRSSEYYLDLSTPFYIYQEKFTHFLGDGSTLSIWNTNIIVSPTPLI